MNDTAIAGLVGLARRGGNLAVGFGACAQAVAQKRAALVIFSEDLSESTAEKLRSKMEGQLMPVIVHGSKAEWGKALGREEVGVMAVLDKGLAKAIMSKLTNTD